MTRRSRIWFGAASLFAVVNLGGAIFAAMQKELPHAGLHAGLMLLGAYAAFLLWNRPDNAPATPSDVSDRLSDLERSVDAVAIEVERVGEGQRFMTRRFAERDEPRAADEKAGAPVERKAPDDPARGD